MLRIFIFIIVSIFCVNSYAQLTNTKDDGYVLLNIKTMKDGNVCIKDDCKNVISVKGYIEDLTKAKVDSFTIRFNGKTYDVLYILK